MKNWITTLTGIGTVATAIGTMATGLAHGDFSVIGTQGPGLIAGIGLLFAKDFNVTGGTIKQ